MRFQRNVISLMSCWVLDHTLRLMQRYIYLSLELELFADREVDIAYWYIKFFLD